MRGNVLIMAGGTGGHVFPALACAREFKARGYAVHWLGTPRGIENELVPAAELPLHLIQVSGLRGKGKLSLLKAPLQLIRALFQARRVMRELKPVCVLGMGGYVTGPGGLAARLDGAPLVIHEQNAVAGTANRSLVPFATRVCEAFPSTFGRRAKLRTTGNPVREELFLETPRDSLAGRQPRLLVLGGSLGAEPLNKLLPAALAKVAADLRPQVFHQAGKQHDQVTAERYREAGVEAEVAPFIKDMARAYA
ncbi:MAG TPA: UDP-N-acetylglucosamine--N-acetylmuramyl-(pentapeptide) pyrophosphoryl-undecaprenol N-acetylglucosamine transferase, partial [Pseudomonas sp.]|nr:UDP-N-acetylglucosamine--N-acetylmuramyl-(pentapeptide) pyrophosphoryl-undecaprenol N-acetylglucosamine transferase [Pseudomonas sp.]